jgi:hypothetical protein
MEKNTMGVYGKVSENKEQRKNAEKMDRYGSFYARIDQTKYVLSPSKGNFAIVECTVIEAHDEGYKNGEFLCHMRSQDEFGFMNTYMTEYVAAFNGVAVGHKFDEDVDKNDEIWDQKKQQVFGAPVMEDGKMVYKHDNPMKGVVAHYKIVPDDQAGRKNKKLDAEGNVKVFQKVVFVGLVPPSDIDPEILAKELPNLHSSYAS